MSSHIETEAGSAPEAGMKISREFRIATIGRIPQALGTHRDRHQIPNPLRPWDEQTYHVIPHLEIASFREYRILRAMQKVAPNLVTDRDIAFGPGYLMPRHDLDQDYEIVEEVRSGRKTRIRKRALKTNEIKTAEQIEKEMASVNDQVKATVFTEDDFRVAREATLLTIPDFVNGTVVQPNFEARKNNLIAQAEGLADIGGGMDDFSVTKWEIYAVFLEDEPDMADLILGNKEPSPEDKAWVKIRVKDRLKEQLVFLEGQKEQRAKDIDSMDERVQGAVRDLFIHYPKNITAVEELIEDIDDDTSFSEIQADFRKTLSEPPHIDLPKLFSA